MFKSTSKIKFSFEITVVSLDRNIIRKRRDFEYVLHRKGAKKTDYLRYMQVCTYKCHMLSKLWVLGMV